MCLTESASSKAMPGAILIGRGIKQAITLLYRDISNVNAVSKEPIEFTMDFDTYLMYFSCAEIVHKIEIGIVFIRLCMCDHF